MSVGYIFQAFLHFSNTYAENHMENKTIVPYKTPDSEIRRPSNTAMVNQTTDERVPSSLQFGGTEGTMKIKLINLRRYLTGHISDTGLAPEQVKTILEEIPTLKYTDEPYVFYNELKNTDGTYNGTFYIEFRNKTKTTIEIRYKIGYVKHTLLLLK